MKAFLSLARLYLQSFYNLPAKKAPGARRDPKAVLKTVGIAALVVFVLGEFGFIFVMLNLGMYEGLAAAGMQGMLILNAVVIATMMTLVVGFMTALSTYYVNDMELQLLSMPIAPRAMFGAKFLSVYASEALFSLFFMGIAMAIFGVKEGPGPLFYLWGVAAALLLPLPPLAAAYIVQIPLMSVARFLKNKRVIVTLGGVLGLVFALGFNVYYQRMMVKLGDPAALAAMVGGADSMVARIGSAYPPAAFAWRAMSEPASGRAVLSMLGLIGSCVALPALALLLLSGAYVRSLVGFNEAHVKKLTRAGSDAFIARRIRAGSPFAGLVAREINMMNREPMYLLNGPFVVVLMPAIIGVMLAVQKDAFLSDPDMAGVLAMLGSGQGAAIAGLVGAFMGTSTSIACTALSRDAKALPFIKSLPVSPRAYMLAKLCHALVFAAFGVVVGVGLMAFVLRLGVVDALAAAAAALALSILLNLAALWLDTANPRLSWDNPIAAMKQNPNSVIAILGCMGLLVGAGFLVFKFSMGTGELALWFGALPFAASAALLGPYLRFAERRVSALEP